MKKAFKGLIFRKNHFEKGIIGVDNEKIVDPPEGAPFETVFYIIPPFIEAHIHGGWGYDFQRGEFDQLEQILIKKGVSIAIPTLMNDSLENLKKISEKFRKYKEEKQTSIFPFLRVEGPFISEYKRGAQGEESILDATEKNIDDFLSIEEIKNFTFAPEIKNAENLVKKALKKGKIPSIGHSNASFSDFEKIYKLGVKHMTHFPNAMSPFHHREIGLTGAGLLYELDLEIIADGIHTSKEFLEFVYKFKKGNFSIVSDLIPPAFTNNFGRKIIDEKGTLLGGGTLVSEQIKILNGFGFALEDIIKIAVINNRKFFNLPIPLLKEGEEASFIILDKELNIEKIFYKGEEVKS